LAFYDLLNHGLYMPLELAKASVMVFVSQPETFGVFLGLLPDILVIGLRQMDKPAIVTKIFRLELWMAIQTQTAVDQSVEVANQKISQVKRTGFASAQPAERRASREEFIAMRAGQALDAIFEEQAVKLAARSAVRICGENGVKPKSVHFDFFSYRIRYLPRGVMEFGRQAGHTDVRPSVEADELCQLSSKSTAG
jgi:hypothetical protein